jgi:hypothetical protein
VTPTELADHFTADELAEMVTSGGSRPAPAGTASVTVPRGASSDHVIQASADAGSVTVAGNTMAGN